VTKVVLPGVGREEGYLCRAKAFRDSIAPPSLRSFLTFSNRPAGGNLGITGDMR
jgi:hypothetical protein